MKKLIKKILKEENDFDWVGGINPATMEEVVAKVRDLRDIGYRKDPEESQLTKAIHKLGLNKDELKTLFTALYHFGDYCHNEGVDIGHQEAYNHAYNEGYSEGYSVGYDERKTEENDHTEDIRKESYDKGYDDGYDDGISDGHEKGYDEGVEVTYHKAFEEGRAYEAGIEVEDLERRESGFDPEEYGEDYDENY
jgi:flagellar biosynthesis/type III secretory pathway protein FliH